jgi:hypothetical protein
LAFLKEILVKLKCIPYLLFSYYNIGCISLKASPGAKFFLFSSGEKPSDDYASIGFF